MSQQIEQTIKLTHQIQLPQILRIIHFNDVYDIQPSDKQPLGGAARFKTAIDQFTKNTHLNQYQTTSLVLFSGDAFSPSVISNKYNGKQMILPLNSFGIDAACYGNHDFDIGIDNLVKLNKQSNFPWILTNVFERGTRRRLAEAQQFIILQKGGYKIGIFALAQNQWPTAMRVQYLQALDFDDFCESAEKMVKLLKYQQKCDFIIALTHMMAYNDIQLANKVDGIDFILGGHDHTIRCIPVKNQTLIVKSGNNFKNLTVLKIFEQKKQNNLIPIQNNHYFVEYYLQQINSKKFKPNQDVQKHVESFYNLIKQIQYSTKILTEIQLDLRFQQIRKNQNVYLNFISDLYRFYLNTDCAFINSGNFRADTVVSPGKVTYGIVTSQIQAYVVVKLATGKAIYQVLENMLSMYPNLGGRFGTISGISFSWNPNNKPHQRIIQETIQIGNQPINFQKKYTIATHVFLAQGGDGNYALKDCVYVDKGKQGSILNHELVLNILDPENVKCVEFSKRYPQIIKIVQFEGKNIVKINPDQHLRQKIL